MGEEHNIELLSQNYRGMNDTGKKKLREVSEQFLKIWKTVNEKIPSPDNNPEGKEFVIEKTI
jgi:hypothetical protein